MAEANNYQMAIDLLRCHLGLSEEEAKQQLGLTQPSNSDKQQGTIKTGYSGHSASMMS